MIHNAAVHNRRVALVKKWRIGIYHMPSPLGRVPAKQAGEVKNDLFRQKSKIFATFPRGEGMRLWR